MAAVYFYFVFSLPRSFVDLFRILMCHAPLFDSKSETNFVVESEQLLQ